MNKTALIGNKTDFAIELGYTKNPKKFYLRFWIQGLPMGTFQKSSDLQCLDRSLLRSACRNGDHCRGLTTADRVRSFILCELLITIIVDRKLDFPFVTLGFQ